MDRDSIIARIAEALLPLVTKDRMAGYARHWFPAGMTWGGYEIGGVETAVIAGAVGLIVSTILSAISKKRVRADERNRVLRDVANSHKPATGGEA